MLVITTSVTPAIHRRIIFLPGMERRTSKVGMVVIHGTNWRFSYGEGCTQKGRSGGCRWNEFYKEFYWNDMMTWENHDEN
jgi:hypothetical protein